MLDKRILLYNNNCYTMDNNQPVQSSQNSPLRWIAFIVIVLVLGAAGFSAVRNNSQNNSKNPNNSTQPSGTAVVPLSPHTLVYGSWTGSGSEITAIDLSTRNSTTLASLPIAIKKVSVVNPTSLIYIDGINNRDHGKRILLYDMENETETASIPASDGFGIDDYVLSPNKQFIAIWEVSFADGSEILQGGRSRVYAVSLSNPTSKQLLYDEVVTAPVHYPRAILNDGKVFADKFMPNDPTGNGWAYGMSVVNFDGTNQKDIDQMKEGTYATQPSLSPDGTLLVFAGYDGSLGDGKELDGGFRRAVLKSNTIETLNTTTLERKKLPNLPNSNTYAAAEWDRTINNIIVTAIPKGKSPELYRYSLASSSLSKIALPTTAYSFISQLSSSKLLVATTEDSQSSVGNLGETYAYLINQLYILDSSTDQVSSLQDGNNLVQYITTLSSDYFQNVLGTQTTPKGGGGNPAQPNVTVIDLFTDKPSKENLQLKTFLLKPELAPIRETQQALPKCRDLAAQQCAEQGSTDPNCAKTTFRSLFKSQAGVCYDSPLYLYGTEGDKVSVKIQTPVYNDTPIYSDGYNITLQVGGNMQVNGQVYSGINYDYRSNLRRITPPSKGTIVSRSGVEKVLREYAKKLGLNDKETTDLVRDGKEKVTSAYAFISFFDHETSSSILPLTFSPKPDNYLNVVFYFKLLGQKPNYTPTPPSFGKPISRWGLTAVEISSVVE